MYLFLFKKHSFFEVCNKREQTDNLIEVSLLKDLEANYIEFNGFIINDIDIVLSDQTLKQPHNQEIYCEVLTKEGLVQPFRIKLEYKFLNDSLVLELIEREVISSVMRSCMREWATKFEKSNIEGKLKNISIKDIKNDFDWQFSLSYPNIDVIEIINIEVAVE